MRELTGATGYKRKLKPDAMPTIFPHKTSKVRPREASEMRMKKRDLDERLGALLSRPSSIASDESDLIPDEDLITTSPQTSTLHAAVSVATMCRPNMIDAATQTDSLTSDAAVQWPADVQEVVAIDHAYPVNLRDWGQEVDSGSLDLSPLEDDFSEDSQPLNRDSDPDYILGLSSSQSSQESHSTANDQESRVFLVFEEQLKQLLQRCLKCGSLIAQEDMRELQNEGSQFTVELTCANSCCYRWQSQPSLSKTKGKGNLLLAASIFFSGIHFAKFHRFCLNMNLQSICEDTYSTLRKRFVFPAVERTWAREQSAVLTSMQAQEAVVLCGDGRCDSPGHSAKYCTYTFLDVHSQKVVDFKVVSVTQVSSSNTMEIRGFKEALATIEENGVKVTTISTDRHPQIVKEMRVSHPEKHHEFDPWHVVKGVSKKLAAVARRKECEGLGEWIPSIVNHFWWSAQTCGGDAEVLIEKWVSVIHHVTNRHDWPGNRHYHSCAHDHLDDDSQRSKLWLQPGSEGHQALVTTVKDKRLLKDLEHLTKCIHTTSLEVYHSMYLKYLPKRTHFGYDVMVHASMLAALDHNNNANREQAVYQDGESVGEPKFKISWSKVHKRFRARPVAVPKGYGYMKTMMEDVMSAVSDTNLVTRESQRHVMAPQDRLPRSQIIAQARQFSRFNK
ncbi:uncharacterized protein LOC134453783 [Engraulis encrasicolus]|uniref:uncharacterized protein LOC134453783 n=1 Tax=Engraulis encrasicolus TaxID=184585 RepID=UPI002FD22069